MGLLVNSDQRFRFISFSLSALLLGSILPVAGWAETAAPLIEPPSLAEPADPVEPETIPVEPEAIPVEPEPTQTVATAPVSPSVHVSGSIWRSKPGIVFLQTPIGPLSLSSKTTLRDVKNSQKITLWVHGTTTVIDIRERGADKLVHRYVTAMPTPARAPG